MTYQFARIDLSQTNYEPCVEWAYIEHFDAETLARLDDIYKTYTTYKHFASVMPVFHSRYLELSKIHCNFIWYRKEAYQLPSSCRFGYRSHWHGLGLLNRLQKSIAPWLSKNH